jgi:hypothetical protein
MPEDKIDLQCFWDMLEWALAVKDSDPAEFKRRGELFEQAMEELDALLERRKPAILHEGGRLLLSEKPPAPPALARKKFKEA